MRCLKCQKKNPPLITKPMDNLPPLLAHLKDWCVCAACIDKDVKATADKAAIYYRTHKNEYRKLHVGYKEDLSDSYVRRQLGTKDEVPKELVQLKRQYMQMNRELKEKNNGTKKR